jgi:hypothetical protein
MTAICLGGIVMAAISQPDAQAAGMSTANYYVRSWSILDEQKGEWQPLSQENAKFLGTTEISVYPPESEPTTDQVKAADELIVQTTAAAFRHNWFDFQNAAKEGYRYHDSIHYMSLDNINDGRILDPDRPENLMYYRNENGELKLAGAMYLMPTNDEHGPQVGGPLTVWHYHMSPVPLCWFDFPTTPNPRLEGPCEIGERNVRSPEMIHVWLVDHPEGVFATRMELPSGTREALQCLSSAPAAQLATEPDLK